MTMAFEWFVLLEGGGYSCGGGGLGGRLDSTNIIMPELSVITNISKDHTAFWVIRFGDSGGEGRDNQARGAGER